MKNKAPKQTVLPAIIDGTKITSVPALPNPHLLNARTLRFAGDIFPVGGKIKERSNDHKHRGKYGGGDKEFDQEFYKFHMGSGRETRKDYFAFSGSEKNKSAN